MENDLINPNHYKQLPVEVIDITENFNFCLGNALKYIMRAGHKQYPDKTEKKSKVIDLQKAIWYLQREIQNSSK